MPVIISLLRGINVGGHNKIRMDSLRELCDSLGLRGAQTYIQSGNVVFQAGTPDLVRLQKKLEDALERKFRFRPVVVLRSLSDWKAAIRANPFAGRPGIDPDRLLVMFLAGEPALGAGKLLSQLRAAPEEVKLVGRELYLYYPNGMSRPKLTWTGLEKLLQVPGTTRNLNTVHKLLEMAGRLEAGD